MRGHRVAAMAALALTAPLMLGACSSDKKADSAAESSSTTSSSVAVNTGPTVDVTEFAFTPNGEVVAANETVTWRNDGTSRHTVTARPLEDGSTPWVSTGIEPGQTFVQTFNTPGTYAYFCSIHPDRMSGTVTVT